jgi:UDP-2,3-diacylglucosamine hydrolase
VYVISDAHLGYATRDAERSLVSFLRHLPGRAGALVINGDLFEFWFEWRRVMPRGTFRVLAALADLHDAGVPVVMVAGNHDCWGGEILRDDAGVAYQLDAWEGELAGWRARIDHGDGLRATEDRRYRMLRRVLRHRLSITLFRWLHPDLGAALAAGSSATSRTYQARDGGAGLRRVAEGELQARPTLDLLVYAHSHVAALERLGTGVFANAGAWLDTPTFLYVQPERIELRRWTGDGEGTVLTVVERPRR